jgi:hypothetical protein
LLRQAVQRVIHEAGNGRALQNAHVALQRDRFLHERIEALAQRLPAPVPATGNIGRGAA